MFWNNKKIDNLLETINRQKAEIEDLQKQVSCLQNSINSLKNNFNESQNSFCRLQSNIDGLQDVIFSVQDDLNFTKQSLPQPQPQPQLQKYSESAEAFLRRINMKRTKDGSFIQESFKTLMVRIDFINVIKKLFPKFSDMYPGAIFKFISERYEDEQHSPFTQDKKFNFYSDSVRNKIVIKENEHIIGSQYGYYNDIIELFSQEFWEKHFKDFGVKPGHYKELYGNRICLSFEGPMLFLGTENNSEQEDSKYNAEFGSFPFAEVFKTLDDNVDYYGNVNCDCSYFEFVKRYGFSCETIRLESWLPPYLWFFKGKYYNISLTTEYKVINP